MVRVLHPKLRCIATNDVLGYTYIHFECEGCLFLLGSNVHQFALWLEILNNVYSDVEGY